MNTIIEFILIVTGSFAMGALAAVIIFAIYKACVHFDEKEKNNGKDFSNRQG